MWSPTSRTEKEPPEGEGLHPQKEEVVPVKAMPYPVSSGVPVVDCHPTCPLHPPNTVKGMPPWKGGSVLVGITRGFPQPASPLLFFLGGGDGRGVTGREEGGEGKWRLAIVSFGSVHPKNWQA